MLNHVIYPVGSKDCQLPGLKHSRTCKGPRFDMSCWLFPLLGFPTQPNIAHISNKENVVSRSGHGQSC